MCDNQTGFVGCTPLKHKSQVKLATCELLTFTQDLGYTTVCYLTDTEPSTRQILRSILHARHALGLFTRISTSKVKGHSNALTENTVNRIRGLCGTLMEQLQSNIKMKIATSNPLWSWAARHAAGRINRYKPVRGAAPYEERLGEGQRTYHPSLGGESG